MLGKITVGKTIRDMKAQQWRLPTELNTETSDNYNIMLCHFQQIHKYISQYKTNTFYNYR